MIIKEVPHTDYELANQLFCDSFHKEYQEIKTPFTGMILGLYLEEELIGVAQIDYIYLGFENKKIGYVNSFCIKKFYRHQGYGDKLLKGCIRVIQEHGGTQIQMTSNKNRIYAHMLYKKNQFEPIDTILLKKDLEKESTLL